MDPWQAFNFDWKLETNIDATKSMAGVVKKNEKLAGNEVTCTKIKYNECSWL